MIIICMKPRQQPLVNVKRKLTIFRFRLLKLWKQFKYLSVRYWTIEHIFYLLIIYWAYWTILKLLNTCHLQWTSHFRQTNWEFLQLMTSKIQITLKFVFFSERFSCNMIDPHCIVVVVTLHNLFNFIISPNNPVSITRSFNSASRKRFPIIARKLQQTWNPPILKLINFLSPSFAFFSKSYTAFEYIA